MSGPDSCEPRDRSSPGDDDARTRKAHLDKVSRLLAQCVQDRFYGHLEIEFVKGEARMTKKTETTKVRDLP